MSMSRIEHIVLLQNFVHVNDRMLEA